MNVADDVERTDFSFLIVVERDAIENDGFSFFRRRKNQDVTKAFTLQAAKGATQVLKLVMSDVIPQPAIGTDVITVLANPFRHIQNDGDRKAMILPRQFNEGLAVFRLNVCSIGNCQTASGKALCGN